MKKKFLAVLLACMIAASVVPAAVSAEDSAVNQIPASTLEPAVVSDGQDTVTFNSEQTVTTEEQLKEAVAQENSVITLGADITLKSTLNVANNVTIDGGNHKLISGFSTLPGQNFEKNLVTFSTGSAGSVLKNVTIQTNQYNRNALNIWCTNGTVTIENVTIDHTSSDSYGGAPLIVGSSSVKVVGNLTLTTGTNSWYGINIDNTYAGAALDFSECTNTNLFTGIAMPILLDKASNGSSMTVTGADKVGLEASIFANVTKQSETEDIGIYFTSFESAIAAMKNSSSLGFTINGVVDIELCDNVSVSQELSFDRPVILDGNGHTLTANFGVAGNKGTNLVTFSIGSTGSVVQDINLVSNENTRNVLNIWQAGDVEINGNVVLDHTKSTSYGGAPMVVTSSNVTVDGSFEMVTGTNSWYAFNVDSNKYDTAANVTFSESSKVTYTDNSGKNLPFAGLDLDESQTVDTAVTDPAKKVIAARTVSADGQPQLFDNLQDAVDAVESTGSTVTVLRSGEEANFNTSSNVKFELAEGVASPVLTDETGKQYEVTDEGLVETKPEEVKYTATINGQATAYKPGTVVSLNAPVYSADRVFVKWVVTSGNAVIANEYSNQTTFVMPEGNVTIQAVYSDIIYQPVLPEIPSYNPGGSSSKPETSKPETSEPETEWKRDDDGNTYFYKDGEKVTGWVEEDGEWYYMNEDTGAMTEESWVKVNNVWYAFDDDGHMLTGWQEIDGKWYYLKDWGGMATGWQQVDGVWYYLKGDGAMATGWVQSNGQWYYLKGNGAMATGWVESNGKWYYLYESGEMATNATIGGYYVNSNGEWVK